MMRKWHCFVSKGTSMIFDMGPPLRHRILQLHSSQLLLWLQKISRLKSSVLDKTSQTEPGQLCPFLVISNPTCSHLIISNSTCSCGKSCLQVVISNPTCLIVTCLVIPYSTSLRRGVNSKQWRVESIVHQQSTQWWLCQYLYDFYGLWVRPLPCPRCWSRYGKLAGDIQFRSIDFTVVFKL